MIHKATTNLKGSYGLIGDMTMGEKISFDTMGG